MTDVANRFVEKVTLFGGMHDQRCGIDAEDRYWRFGWGALLRCSLGKKNQNYVRGCCRHERDCLSWGIQKTYTRISTPDSR